MSAYNLWYLLLLGCVHNVSSALHPAGLPLSYQQLGHGLFCAFVLLVVGLEWRQKGELLAVPAALLSAGLFMLLTDVHERYLFPALAFLLLGAVGWDGHPRDPASKRPGLWSAYSVLSLTFLFNLVTIAPFTPALGTNLVAIQPPYSARDLVLKALSLLAAAANTLVLAWLVTKLAREPANSHGNQ